MTPKPIVLRFYHTDMPPSSSTNRLSQPPTRHLDFVREKVASLTEENTHLKEKIQDLEISLAIVQTAQAWDLDRMPLDQQKKIQQLSLLLREAKKSKEELNNCNKTSTSFFVAQIERLHLELREEKREKNRLKESLARVLDFLKRKKLIEEKEKVERESLSEKKNDAILLMKKKHQDEIEKHKNKNACNEEKIEKSTKTVQRLDYLLNKNFDEIDRTLKGEK